MCVPIFRRGYGRQRRGRSWGRLGIAAVIALIAIVTYFGRSSINPITGQKQRIALTVDEEIALGLQSAPEMARQFGGLHPDAKAQALVDEVGQRLVAAIPEAGKVYPFEFHLLADGQTVNAFALPGGQIFITAALFERFRSEGQLAGVLGHEIGHVIHRHSAEHLAKSQLMQGLVGAVAVGTYDPGDRNSQYGAMIAAAVGQMINLKYGRDDELESDTEGVRVMARAGYDPRSMIEVMEILKQAGGGRGTPEFMSSHPDPGNRAERIKEAIQREFPAGVPEGLKP